jgi:hypothetical protein
VAEVELADRSLAVVATARRIRPAKEAVADRRRQHRQRQDGVVEARAVQGVEVAGVEDVALEVVVVGGVETCRRD